MKLSPSPDAKIDIVFFGGSFDPPHSGHTQCVEIILQEFPKAKVLLIPAQQAANAKNQELKIPHATFLDRVKMCELILEKLETTRAWVSDIEKSLPIPNYSLATIEKLSQLYPGKKIAMVIGSDQWQSFDQWYKPQEILAKASVVVLSRVGYQIKNKPGNVYVFEREILDVKSQTLRQKLAKGESIDLKFLPTKLQEYIKAKGLYKNTGMEP